MKAWLQQTPALVANRYIPNGLKKKFADAAELSSCQLAHFRRVKSFRGDKHDFEGPDAILHGRHRRERSHPFF